MKRYKLIKRYPGSGVEGAIVEFSNSLLDDIVAYSGTGKCPSRNEAKNNPEYWEEIKDKEYEILSWIGNDVSSALEGKIYKNEPINYRDDKWHNERLNIHSVKRLSDGEIFTIGDKIKNKDTRSGGLIKSFLLITEENYDNKVVGILSSKIGQIAVQANYNLPQFVLNEIERAKNPLFTTEDGVERYIDDKYYISLGGNTISEMVVKSTHKTSNFKDGYKRFSTYEACREFMDRNKKIKIGDYEVEFYPEGIKISNRAYSTIELKKLQAILDNHHDQIKSLNVGCNGQYKVDLELINKIIAKLTQM